MKTIENAASFFFIIAVTILSCISILGIWELFDEDVIGKSFQTLGLLAVVAVIVMVASRYFEGRSAQTNQMMPSAPNPAFKKIRQNTIAILVISASLLALLGVLTIWDVITDKDILYKSMGSLGVLVFGSFVIIMTTLEREGGVGGSSKKMSTGAIVGLVILAYFILTTFSSYLFYVR